MHELSVAVNIIEIAEENAKKEGIDSVDEIEIEIGEMSGVELDALEFAMEISVKNTVLEKAKRTIILIPGRAKCLDCSFEFDIHDFYSACPECDSFKYDIVKGKELRIKSLIVY